jgi:hydroxymethylbilane synthase
MSSSPTVRIATRGSLLARWQAEWVAQELRKLGVEPQIVEVSTEGDRRDKQQIANLGSQGVFTKEIQHAVLDGRADLAVHSFKDLPTAQTPGMVIAAVPHRADPADALVANIASSLDTLPVGARVGTSSVRRRAQLLRLRPDLRIVNIRGNVDTRLAKLDRGSVDALVLAAAGLVRLEHQARIAQRFDPHVFVPAVGQGALAIECREDDSAVHDLVGSLDHGPTRLATHLERSLLKRLRAGCLAPLGAFAECGTGKISFWAVVLSVDGRSRLWFEGSAPAADAEKLAEKAAARLLADGAGRMIAASRE